MIIRKEEGFTLIELLVTMVVFVFVMAAASRIFTGLLTQFKQQSKIAETNIEGLVGLEMLRQDLEHMGYGIPWIIPAAVSNYNEGGAVIYKDCPAGPPCNAPRAVASDNGTSFNGSDYLVIKSVNVSMTDTSQKWTTLKNLPACDVNPGSENPRKWVPQNEMLNTGDNVIVVAPGSTDINARRLVVDATSSFNTTYGNVCSSPWPPADNLETRLVYGINSANDLIPQRPFNRADFFISTTDKTGNNIVPSRCASNTGVLVKAVIRHDIGGTLDTYLALLDCVADMQVAYALDNDENGNFEDGVGGDAYSDIITGLTAEQIRNRVKEIRVYILAHEGQRDQSYTYPSPTIEIPPVADPAAGLGRPAPGFNLAGDPNYKYYRWKIYTISVKPIDLR